MASSSELPKPTLTADEASQALVTKMKLKPENHTVWQEIHDAIALPLWQLPDWDQQHYDAVYGAIDTLHKPACLICTPTDDIAVLKQDYQRRIGH